ncbi:hypothetical protein [Actomonas aquatica]|uniref:Uncharacterized protein n=1 Tax=Actomonas aquatica TaxID=2866162 RepID=A0ABZ1CBZ6_9BACT|nr:hypothetical protein [Opitutus sp. WL0086]WRQ89203.1 hypothetical protein K1X11_007270 [Opitutus sp. WL0086]
MSTASTRSSFLERYCHFYSITEDAYPPHVLKRCLHAPLRWFFPVFRAALTDYLEPDIICVRAAARLTGRRELEGELAEFSYHPRNRSFWRGPLKQRLSTHRLRRLFRELPAD